MMLQEGREGGREINECYSETKKNRSWRMFHEGTHSGWTAPETTLAQHFYVPKLSSISKTVYKRYSLCARNNPQHLLVFVCTFSGWIKAFPTRTEKSQDVARCLLKKVIP
jgi:hypothetical protein